MDLLGALLTLGEVVVRLSEVEAYAGADDPASHAARGRTARNATMFGPPGHAYVYLSHGLHWCLNVVTGEAGQPGAVLLRAGLVVAGLETARDRRPSARVDLDLARGPGRLGQALGVTGELDGCDLVRGPLAVHEGPPVQRRVVAGPRVGVSVATQVPWRFHLEGEASVSRWRPGARGTSVRAPRSVREDRGARAPEPPGPDEPTPGAPRT